MWKSHRSSGIGGKSLEAGVLLAHNAQRRNRTSQKMQSLLGARQNLSPPIRATEVSYKPLAFSAVGATHIGTSAHWKGVMQIYRRSSGLFHQMGRSRALGYYHKTKTLICLKSGRCNKYAALPGSTRTLCTSNPLIQTVSTSAS